MVIIILNLIINFVADPFYDNKSQRTTIDDTPLNNPVFCNTQLSEAWYRFVTAARTRTPSTCVDSCKCGKANPGWLTL